MYRTVSLRGSVFPSRLFAPELDHYGRQLGPISPQNYPANMVSVAKTVTPILVTRENYITCRTPLTSSVTPSCLKQGQISLSCQIESMHWEKCLRWLLLSLQWRHNGCDSVSNHQPHHCFTQLLIQAQMKENIKAPRHWPLCGEFTGEKNNRETGDLRRHYAHHDVSVMPQFGNIEAGNDLECHPSAARRRH